MLPAIRLDPAPDRSGDSEHRKFSAGLRDELLAFARRVFELERPEADGKPARAHLEVAAKNPLGAEARKQLILPPLPEAVEYLWDWFLELEAARPSGDMGPKRIGYADIEAWARVLRRQPTLAEIETLLAIDRLGFQVKAEGKR